MASSLNSSHDLLFLTILSQNEANNSALELLAIPLHTTSNVSFSACKYSQWLTRVKKVSQTNQALNSNTNLMEKWVMHEAISDVCQILVMQLNNSPYKNLKDENQFNFHPIIYSIYRHKRVILQNIIRGTYFHMPTIVILICKRIFHHPSIWSIWFK